MKMKKNFPLSLFILLLCSYGLMFILPLSVSCVIFNKAVDAVKNEVVVANLSEVQRMNRAVNNLLSGMEDVLSLLSINPQIVSFAVSNSDDISSDVFGVRDTIRTLGAYRCVTDFIDEIFIYFDNADVVLTTTGKYEAQSYYNMVYHFDDLSYEDWQIKMRSKRYSKSLLPYYSQFSDTPDARYLTYVQTIPLDSSNVNHNNLVVLCNVDNLTKLADTIANELGWHVWLFNNDGKPMPSKESEISSNIQKNYETIMNLEPERLIQLDKSYWCMTRLNNGCNLLIEIPENVLMVGARKLQWLIGVMLFGTGIVGLILAVYMAYRYYAPVRGIIKLFMGEYETPVEVNELSFIHSSVKETLERNREIEAKIHHQVPIVRSDAFRRILTGMMPKEWLSKAPSQLLNIVPKGDTYVVLVFNINLVEDLPDGTTGDDVVSFFVTADHLLNGFIAPVGQIYVVELSDGKICTVANFKDDIPWEEVRNRLDTGAEKLREFIQQRYGVQVQVAMGNPCKGLENIRQSYRQAQEVMAYCQWIKENGMTHYCDISLTGAWYNYPVEMEIKLINIVKMGNYEEAASLAGSIIEENVGGVTLQKEAAQSFILNMFNTFLRALYETKGDYEMIIGEDMKQTLSRIEHSHWVEVKAQFVSMFYKLGFYVDGSIKDHSMIMLEKIKTYVQDHYDDQCLDLNTIAYHCGLSASYLSSFYKSQTGENLTNFITLIRIEASKRLLCKNCATIAEIAQQVGYSNEYSFSRAFKRQEGVPPGRYKVCSNN